MPLIPDYDPEDDELSTGPIRGGSAVGGARMATPSRQQEQAYVPWQRFVSANESVSKREANSLGQQVQSKADDVTKRRDDAAEAQSEAIASNYLGYKPKAPSQPTQTFGQPKAFANNEGAQTHQPWGSFVGPQSEGQVLRDMKPEPPPPTPQSSARQGDLNSTGQVGTFGPPANLGVSTAKPVLDPDKLYHDPKLGKSVGFGIAGAPDLEAQLGVDAWKRLIGDTQRAQQQATALGSEAGVQSLLEQGTVTPNSAFDAALIGGAGAPMFRDLSQRYGGNQLTNALSEANTAAQGRWKTLLGDVDAAAQVRDRDIAAATEEAQRLAAEQANVAAEQQKAEEARNWLEEKFPVAEQFKNQETALDWIEDNRHGGTTGYSNLLAWADQIYGGATQENVDRLYRDIRNMTPEEYAAFMYGMVPPWMGNGTAASGFNGGSFYGLGNTGNRITGVTTGKASAENQKFWSEWRAALEIYYQALAAIATAAAYAAGGPLAGAAVGAGAEALLGAEKAASNGGS